MIESQDKYNKNKSKSYFQKTSFPNQSKIKIVKKNKGPLKFKGPHSMVILLVTF